MQVHPGGARRLTTDSLNAQQTTADAIAAVVSQTNIDTMAAAAQMSALPKHVLTATALGNVSVLTQWIEDGGDPNARTIDGHTLPSVAAIFCRLDSMTVLVERGARVDVADGDGWTPLIEAVVFQPGIESNDDHRVRRRELVDLLLTHDASVDRRTADGMTVCGNQISGAHARMLFP